MPEKFEPSHPDHAIEREPAKEVPDHFDALVVLGKNWREYPPSNAKELEEFKLRLSIESKMAALAAGEMFKEGIVDKIIFSGGKTAGKEYPSESEAMVGYLRGRYPDIPEEMVAQEDSSIDTAENAERIAEIIAEDPALQKIALMTIGFHMPRAEQLFKEFGIEATPFPSEGELKKHSPRYGRFIASYLKSGHVRTEKVKELILRSLLYIDAKGKIPHLLTKRIRHST